MRLTTGWFAARRAIRCDQSRTPPFVARSPAVDEGCQELAGATFSPDGRTLCTPIQFSSGLTFSIWREDGGTFFKEMEIRDRPRKPFGGEQLPVRYKESALDSEQAKRHALAA